MIPHFIKEGPALLVEGNLRVLVVADLHFGAESEYARRGVHIPSNSPQRTERLLSCIDTVDPDLLILLGDIKHGVPLTSRQEFRELPDILPRIRERVLVRVLPGNHDAGIGRFLQKDELLPKEGVCIDGCGYMHGHVRPAPALFGGLIICGHHHPVVHLFDAVGCACRAHPAYLLAELDQGCLAGNRGESQGAPTRVLFVPAFFELAGGIDVREIKKSKISPISRCIREEGAEVFLSDGTYINSLTALTSPDDS